MYGDGKRAVMETIVTTRVFALALDIPVSRSGLASAQSSQGLKYNLQPTNHGKPLHILDTLAIAPTANDSEPLMH